MQTWYASYMHLASNHRAYKTLPAVTTESGAYQPVSFWHETVDITPGPPLTEDIACDVAIVGGGFTGLSIAHQLKRAKPALEIVLIERAVVGHGASGRNGGFVMPLIGWDLHHVARKLGEETAGAAYRLMYDAVDYVKHLVAEHNIDCDLEETGYLLLNTCSAREARAREELAIAHRLGFDHAWLEGAALREHIRSEHFRSGVFDPNACILNPAKLARGLKSLVEELGVSVYEQTSLEELTDGNPVQLRSPHGTIQAERVVLALNGYGPSLGFMEARVLPVHTYIVVTEPLDDAQLEAVGWSNKRTSLETARNFIHYFRLTADNRILFGGEDAQVYHDGAYRDADPRIFGDLKARFREYFPALAGVSFTHEWGGVLGVSLDMFPTFGVGGENDTIYHAGAYAGHGVSLSNYAGCILAPHILGEEALPDAAGAHPPPFFYNRTPAWLAKDPFRYWGMQVYRHALRAQDWWQGA